MYKNFVKTCVQYLNKCKKSDVLCRFIAVFNTMHNIHHFCLSGLCDRKQKEVAGAIRRARAMGQYTNSVHS